MKPRPHFSLANAPTPGDGVLWDRRRAPRHAASESRLWLGWRAEQDFVVTAAELMNISQGGALVVAERSPARGDLVWLRLEGPASIEDVCAAVIEATRIGRGEYGIRVTFREPFPPEFYQAAVEGLAVLKANAKV